jgi:hypothetical protein
MARQRRGGFKPPELRGTLGTLLRTAAQQANVVREAVGNALERGAREGRSRIDELRSDRRRREALVELGEIVLDLVRKGEIDLAELPEAQSVIDHLDELDAGQPEPERSDEPTAEAAPRQRFDDRRARPPTRLDDDDGTVSSAAEPKRRTGRETTLWRTDAPASGPKPAAKQGGIQFDDADDADLADYMHPDDVPPKG